MAKKQQKKLKLPKTPNPAKQPPYSPDSKQRFTVCVVGERASGKTEKSKQEIKKYAQKFPNQKVLVLDPNNEYKDLKAIKPKDIAKINEPSRIVPKTIDEVREMMRQIAYNYTEGIVLYEGFPFDRDMQADTQMQQMLKRTLRQDTVFHYVSFSQIPRRLFENCDFIRIHNHKDYNDKQIDTDGLAIAKLIMHNYDGYDKHRCIYYNTHTNKITGANKWELLGATYKYYMGQIESIANKLNGNKKPEF